MQELSHSYLARKDETYIKVKGKWEYLYRAVDSQGATVNYLPTAKRDRKAALRFLNHATKSCGKPESVTIDKRGSNRSAMEIYNSSQEEKITVSKNKYLNNLIEQDHRGIKQLCKAMLGFKSSRTAKIALGGFEAMKMLRKAQTTNFEKSRVEQFYDLLA